MNCEHCGTEHEITYRSGVLPDLRPCCATLKAQLASMTKRAEVAEAKLATAERVVEAARLLYWTPPYEDRTRCGLRPSDEKNLAVWNAITDHDAATGRLRPRALGIGVPSGIPTCDDCGEEFDPMFGVCRNVLHKQRAPGTLRGEYERMAREWLRADMMSLYYGAAGVSIASCVNLLARVADERQREIEQRLRSGALETIKAHATEKIARLAAEAKLATMTKRAEDAERSAESFERDNTTQFEYIRDGLKAARLHHFGPLDGSRVAHQIEALGKERDAAEAKLATVVGALEQIDGDLDCDCGAYIARDTLHALGIDPSKEQGKESK